VVDDIERCEPTEGWLFEESCSEQDLISVAVPVGGAGSCAELDIPGEPNPTGTLSISPEFASFDDFMTVSSDVDADTSEVSASPLDASSGIAAGF
jgi:hypothetical protein